MPIIKRRSALLLLGSVPLVAACGGDPLEADKPSGAATDGAAITVGSANFAESEIIGELYAQVLEAAGYTIKRQMQIGARDAYLKALGDGSISLIGEYSGNLLRFYDKEATASASADVTAALAKAIPDTLVVLDPAEAEDRDAYHVTQAFSDEHGITSLDQLAKFGGQLRIGGQPELAERDYGPPGLTKVYGVPADKMKLTPISDGGGPLTVKALKNGDVDMVNIFSTSPDIKANGFVTLTDPKNMIVAQNIIPLAAKGALDEKAVAAVNGVQKILTTDDLVGMNAKNAGADKVQPKAVATEWLKQKGLLK